MQVYIGVVRWFKNNKGFGFIGRKETAAEWPLDDGKDIFVHYTGIAESGYKALKEGDVVQFCIEEGTSSRLQATHVTKIKNETTTQDA